MGCSLCLYHFLCFLLLFHLHFLATCSSSSPLLCPHDQSFALLQFKRSLSIDSYVSSCYYYDYEIGRGVKIASYPKTDSWKESTDCCSWDGVTCDNLTGHVIGLDLSCSRLYGTIPPNSSLFLLPHLKRLNLAHNDFGNSRISSQFGSLASLTHLNLSFSSFSGHIPHQISQLSRLISLDLSSNWLRLTTPTLKQIVQNLTEVRELFLDGIYMSSVAPSSLMNLSSSLTSLSLSDCQLRGNFPSNIFYQPKLQLLRLNYNFNLSGYFPKSNLSGPLELLDVSQTLFSGELPDSIGNLESLKYLSLYRCNFTGSIPSSLKNLKQLTVLYLGDNNFTSPIPDVFGNLSKLTSLYLGLKDFVGQLPSSVFDLSQLENLYAFNFQLVGSIPYQVCRLSNLVRLYLCNNLLNGTIPSCLYTLPSLQSIDLSDNKLTGDIKEFQSKSLRNINLSDNQLTGDIKEFQSKSLTYIDLRNNNLHGSLPSSIFELVNLTLLYLDSNNLSGNMEIDMFSKLKNLKILDLHSNLLQGPLPIPPSTLEFFSISNNSLTGELSSLICNSSSLYVLDISHNNLSGIIPPCLGNLSKSLSVLNLQKNNFHGIIPVAFSKDCGLQNLNLNGNQLGGSLPQSMVNCRYLQVVDLGNNNINDTFPYWFGNLPELQVLVLHSNKFHGYMRGSRTYHSFSKLRIFDLSNNNFFGPLPIRYIKSFKAMINVSEGKSDSQYMSGNTAGPYSYDFSVSVTMKGFEFELVKILTILTSIDLSNNLFEGEIPEVIGKLSSLKGLNLSHNNLGGHIPPKMGNLTNLEWLDLSSNKLVGEIPRQLVDLISLEILNVSHNQLVGFIPQGNQFYTFQNDSYEGNSGLCGFPLTKTCNYVEPKLPPESTFNSNDDSDSAYEFGWKVVLMGYGCGMVFGIVMGYLVFRSGKPKWFVMFVEGVQYRKEKRSKKNASRSGIRN